MNMMARERTVRDTERRRNGLASERRHIASDRAGSGGSLSSSTGCFAIQASRTPWCAAATTHRATSAGGSRFLLAADVSTAFVIMPVHSELAMGQDSVTSVCMLPGCTQCAAGSVCLTSMQLCRSSRSTGLCSGAGQASAPVAPMTLRTACASCAAMGPGLQIVTPTFLAQQQVASWCNDVFRVYSSPRAW